MGLESITSLNDLNVALKNTLDLVHNNQDPVADNTPITISWGGAARDFSLLLKDNKQVTVKMTDILAKFQELIEQASKTSSPDKMLIGNICDRIVELDFEGDVKLSQEGSIGLRNFLHLFQTSHLSVIDEIQKKYLFKDYKILEKTQEILQANLSKNQPACKEILVKAINNPEELILTANALRSIVITIPESAKDILKPLKSILNKIDSSVPNPTEEIEAMKQFLDALIIDVNSRGLFRDDKIEKRAKGNHVSTKPKPPPKAPDFEILRSYGDKNSYVWVPGKLAIKFTYEDSKVSKEKKEKMETDINNASQQSFYMRKIAKLREINLSEEPSITQTSIELSSEDVYFLLGKGLSKTQFNLFLCQEIWDDLTKKYADNNLKLQTKQMELLDAMINNVSVETIQEFLNNNKLNKKLLKDYSKWHSQQTIVPNPQ